MIYSLLQACSIPKFFIKFKERINDRISLLPRNLLDGSDSVPAQISGLQSSGSIEGQNPLPLTAQIEILQKVQNMTFCLTQNHLFISIDFISIDFNQKKAFIFIMQDACSQTVRKHS